MQYIKQAIVCLIALCGTVKAEIKQCATVPVQMKHACEYCVKEIVFADVNKLNQCYKCKAQHWKQGKNDEDRRNRIKGCTYETVPPGPCDRVERNMKHACEYCVQNIVLKDTGKLEQCYKCKAQHWALGKNDEDRKDRIKGCTYETVPPGPCVRVHPNMKHACEYCVQNIVLKDIGKLEQCYECKAQHWALGKNDEDRRNRIKGCTYETVPPGPCARVDPNLMHACEYCVQNIVLKDTGKLEQCYKCKAQHWALGKNDDDRKNRIKGCTYETVPPRPCARVHPNMKHACEYCVENIVLNDTGKLEQCYKCKARHWAQGKNDEDRRNRIKGCTYEAENNN